MLTKTPNFSKNILNLDIVIHQSRLRFIPWAAFVIAVMLISWQALLVGQCVLLLAIISVLSWIYVGRIKIVWMGCTHTDGLWQLSVGRGIGRGVRRQLWQAYLLSSQRAIGMNGAVVLKFYVIEPRKRYFEVMIHRRDVADADYRKLLGLCALSSKLMAN
ncbi:hypothetical protein MOVS_03215 [Moraxella ovis]|uniref:Uncharacterized protein n=1 Tax=Moraxella ovis TaxID=29433 RepID=A0A378PIT8_9GAMM|nr:hypothetical protein [Moraxella ovis]ANB91155.1 hypothetical protein MOVS_03215 [Moraxella ovis]STY86685.1 Uncharacterised protein [Moraxella ovis]